MFRNELHIRKKFQRIDSLTFPREMKTELELLTASEMATPLSATLAKY